MDNDLKIATEMRERDVSWADIGAYFGISRQATIARYSDRIAYKPNPVGSRAARIKKMSDNVSDYMELEGPVTRQMVLDKFDLTPSDYIVLDLPKHLIISPAKRNSSDWTDAEICAQLRQAFRDKKAQVSGATYLGSADYDLWHADKPRGEVISLPGLSVRFGGWAASCELAGIPYGKANRKYTRKWDRQECLRAVADYIDECYEAKIRPTYGGYDLMQRRHPEYPSGSTVRNTVRMGWIDIVTAAVQPDISLAS